MSKALSLRPCEERRGKDCTASKSRLRGPIFPLFGVQLCSTVPVICCVDFFD